MYEKIRNLFVRDIDFYICITLVIVCISAIGIGIWAICNNRAGVNSIGTQLEQAQHNQQSITNEIATSREEAASVRTEMSEFRSELNKVRGELQDSRELIEDCQRILEAVRKRGQGQAKKN